MTSKDLQLINEKYHQIYAQNHAQQMLNEGLRRDFFKQIMGTIAASAIEIKNELMQLSNRGGKKGWIINIDFISQNQWQKIVEPIVGSSNATRYASQIKTAIENKRPLKIDDRLAKQIVTVVQTDTSMGDMGIWNNYTINTEISKVISELQKQFHNQETASQFKQKVLDAFANQKAPNGASMLPAGDLVSYSANKTYYAADEMIKKGMFVGDKAIEDIVHNVTTKYAHEFNNVDFKTDAQKAKVKDDIEYSPADYLGGAPAGGSEQHGYKLAVDNVYATEEPDMHITDSGSKMWYLHGKRHREDGPALELYNGDKHWYMDNLRHREDGPAVEYANGDKMWFLRGKNYAGDVKAWARDVLKLYNKPHDEKDIDAFLYSLIKKKVNDLM